MIISVWTYTMKSIQQDSMVKRTKKNECKIPLNPRDKKWMANTVQSPGDKSQNIMEEAALRNPGDKSQIISEEPRLRRRDS